MRKFAEQVRKHYPNCPPSEENFIAERACQKNSGRVGRSDSAKRLDPGIINLAVWAHIRHQNTEYDMLLADGLPREEAKNSVTAEVDSIIVSWIL
ncbi:DUF2293 domain-containing protein [Candidatus Neomarinimicrobiota bacterium]